LARRSQPDGRPESLPQSPAALLINFAEESGRATPRGRVIALIPAFHKRRDIGSSLLMPKTEAPSARDRIIVLSHDKRVIS